LPIGDVGDNPFYIGSARTKTMLCDRKPGACDIEYRNEALPAIDQRVDEPRCSASNVDD
jgi:hypothetical protein